MKNSFLYRVVYFYRTTDFIVEYTYIIIHHNGSRHFKAFVRSHIESIVSLILRFLPDILLVTVTQEGLNYFAVLVSCQFSAVV